MVGVAIALPFLVAITLLPARVDAADAEFEQLEKMGAALMSPERAPSGVLPFCVNAARMYEQQPRRGVEIYKLAATTCMRALRSNAWCPQFAQLCSREQDREATAAWLLLFPPLAPGDEVILAKESAAGAERARLRTLKAGVAPAETGHLRPFG